AHSDSEIEEQAEEGHVNHRVFVARARGSEAEGARSGLRHGAAAVGIFPESAPVVTPAWGAGGSGTDRAVRTSCCRLRKNPHLATSRRAGSSGNERVREG